MIFTCDPKLIKASLHSLNSLKYSQSKDLMTSLDFNVTSRSDPHLLELG